MLAERKLGSKEQKQLAFVWSLYPDLLSLDDEVPASHTSHAF